VVIIASRRCRAASDASVRIIAVMRSRSASLTSGLAMSQPSGAAGGGDVDRPAVALDLAVAQLRLDDHRQHGIAGGGVGDEDHHVGEVLDGDGGAHVGRGEGDGGAAGQGDAGGALEEVHGDLGVLADQVQRPLVRH
jgi:hypothetical protein